MHFEGTTRRNAGSGRIVTGNDGALRLTGVIALQRFMSQNVASDRPSPNQRPLVEHTKPWLATDHPAVVVDWHTQTPVALTYLRLSGESLENRHTSSAQYKRESSLLSEQWTQPAPRRASATSTHIEVNTFAGVASGMVSWRRGGVGDPVSYTHLTLPTICSV